MWGQSKAKIYLFVTCYLGIQAPVKAELPLGSPRNRDSASPQRRCQGGIFWAGLVSHCPLSRCTDIEWSPRGFEPPPALANHRYAKLQPLSSRQVARPSSRAYPVAHNASVNALVAQMQLAPMQFPPIDIRFTFPRQLSRQVELLIGSQSLYLMYKYTRSKASARRHVHLSLAGEPAPYD